MANYTECLQWIDTLNKQEKIYAMDIHEHLANKGIKPRKNISNHRYLIPIQN